MELQQLARGLWRRTEPHPDWEAPEEEDSPADWPREVGRYTRDDLRRDLRQLLDLPVERALA